MIKDPSLLKKDPLYSTYGPVAICGFLQKEYGRLFKDKDWPTLTSSFESNNVTTVISSRKAQDKKKRCHECGSEDHLQNTCPLLGRAPHQKQQSLIASSSSGSSSSSTNAPSSSSDDPSIKYPWKYIHLTDENQTMTMDDKIWKFCKHCVCRQTKKKGFYNLSHTSSEHIDNFRSTQTLSNTNSSSSNSTSIDTTPSVNLSSTSNFITVPTSNITNNDEFFDAHEDAPIFNKPSFSSSAVPEVSLTSDESDELFFTGIWMSAIDNQSEPQILSVTPTIPEMSKFFAPLEEENVSTTSDPSVTPKFSDNVTSDLDEFSDDNSNLMGICMGCDNAAPLELLCPRCEGTGFIFDTYNEGSSSRDSNSNEEEPNLLATTSTSNHLVNNASMSTLNNIGVLEEK